MCSAPDVRLAGSCRPAISRPLLPPSCAGLLVFPSVHVHAGATAWLHVRREPSPCFALCTALEESP